MAEGTVPAARCAACGAAGVERYCPVCGQRALAGRHTVRGMLGGFFSRVLNLERGLLHTMHALTVRPGVVLRDFLAGRTAPYTHPAGYLLLSFAAFAFASQLLGGLTGGGNDRVFVLLLVPFVAGAARLLFWRAGRNYAEHLLVVMFVVAHIVLFLALLHPLLAVVSQGTAQVILLVAVAASGCYYAWAYSRAFPSAPLAAAAGGLAALVAGAAVWMIALAALLRVVRG